MKRLDDTPVDPEVAASLDAIDATLAGDPVDPKYAEIAELALLLTAERPECSDEFAQAMDARVARRFGPVGGAATAGAAGAAPQAPATKSGRSPWRSWWTLAPVLGGGAVAAAVALALVLSSGSSPIRYGSAGAFSASPPVHGVTAAASGAANSPAKPPAGAFSPAKTPARQLSSASGSWSAAAASTAAASTPNAALSQSPTPPSSGRKIIQSSQLALSTPASRIDAVAQEVFNVVGAESGFVDRSSVTASNSPAAYANFQLSIPSGNLAQTLGQLSRLRYASVASRTDNTQDVNNQYVGDQRALANAKALRTALLKQLANAVTTQQIDSLQAQLRDADRQISSDESALRTLNHEVSYSQVQLSINAATPLPVAHKGFTIGKAAHDAGRVLTVAAGVALIVLAVLVPLMLVVALGWWISSAVQRRRREQALDLA